MLHSAKRSVLDWPMRYKIAVSAAEGLSYLHHDCKPPIVHRDVKSNNILLDAEYGAKVADFGVAKAIGDSPATMSIVAGSCGYIAPGELLMPNSSSCCISSCCASPFLLFTSPEYLFYHLLYIVFETYSS